MTVALALRTLLLLACLLPLGSGTPSSDGESGGEGPFDSILDNLEWRSIGPAIMGGRIDDFAVVESDPRIIYAATASGGLWKTTNRAVTWEPVFDDQPVSSIGDVAVAPSDPSVVWVGTGEANNRQSSSWGNGVYKSTDGGDTWTHMGLPETHHIGRIVIHPTDPDIVYVAALGHLWGPNPERGLYKTTDGGETWSNTLFVDEDTGFTDVVMDPSDPEILYAAAYQRRRTVFGFNGEGPGSGLYKTVDGGDTWTKLHEGLPHGSTGRIGIDVYRKDPNIVYARIEHAEGGVFRSGDKGESWERVSDTNPRPGYYGQIRIDPVDDQRIWVLGARAYTSEDGGRTFREDLVRRIHGDFHALWIDPANPDEMVLGSDGGIHLSSDGGRSWEFVNTLPLGQFYEITVDMDTPYNILGGLQDNSMWRGPSRTLHQIGITNEDWTLLGGGDGLYIQVDPTDPSTIYFTSQYGNLQRFDLETTETKTIKPEATWGEDPYRFDWNSPILISPHDPKTIYFGGNRLFTSTDGGDSWTATPDLTTDPDRDSMPIMGVVPNHSTLSQHDGTATFGEIVTISESPLVEGLLYVGTDDGNLQVSRDGGESWRNVAGRVPGLPGGTYVSRLVASSFAEGRIYATFDGHRSDDYGVYVFVSEDFGESWSSISSNVPHGHTVSVIREHPQRESLLFLGTEFGAYVSFDRGGQWHRLGGRIPTVPVDDIAIHPRENDLILGTHGRSLYVLDDMTPLVELSDAVVQADLHLFDVRPATIYRLHSHRANVGHQFFVAPNPPYGAMIHYTLGAEAEEAPTVTIQDENGDTIRTLRGSSAAGLNRTTWDLRYPRPVDPPEEDIYFLSPPGWRPNGFPMGPLVLPGTYTVQVALGGLEKSTTVEVLEDPRIEISRQDSRERLDAILRLGRLMATANDGDRGLQDLKEELGRLRDRKSLPGEARAVTDSVFETLDRLEWTLSRTGGLERSLGSAGPPPPGRPIPIYVRLNGLYNALNSFTEAPSREQRDRMEKLSRELDELLARLRRLVEVEVPRLRHLEG